MENIVTTVAERMDAINDLTKKILIWEEDSKSLEIT